MGSQSAFCPYCGVETQEEWVHCAACGGELPDNEANEPTPTSSSRKGLWIGLVAVATAVVLVTVLWVVDQALRAQSVVSWLTVTESAEATMEGYLDSEAAATAEWNRRTNSGANQTEAAYGAWVDAVSGAASERSSELMVQQDELDKLEFLPWHAAIDVARDDYTEHVQAWLAVLDEVVQLEPDDDYDAIWAKHGPDIEATFLIAKSSAEAAVPANFVGDLRERVTAEFAN